LYLDELTNEEIEITERKLSDYVDWYDAVEFAVKEAVKENEKNA